MKFISYAQNYEDVMLWRALKHIKNGFYIDVGANDPEIDSVTKAFYDAGWSGINIEPLPAVFNKISATREQDINLCVAAGSKAETRILYELSASGLSTFDLSIAERHRAEQNHTMTERRVQVRTLTDICREYGIVEVHFLKIDVEGAEKEVLCSLDLKTIRPWIIIAEATMPNTQIEDFSDWEPILLHNEYEYVYFDGLNRFYIAKEHQELKTSLSIPPNVFDDFIQYDHSRLIYDYSRLVHENHTLKNEIEAQKKQLGALYASNSWRITEPLRQISKMALKITGRTQKNQGS